MAYSVIFDEHPIETWHTNDGGLLPIEGSGGTYVFDTKKHESWHTDGNADFENFHIGPNGTTLIPNLKKYPGYKGVAHDQLGDLVDHGDNMITDFKQLTGSDFSGGQYPLNVLTSPNWTLGNNAQFTQQGVVTASNVVLGIYLDSVAARNKILDGGTWHDPQNNYVL